jgi:hypothetical protein
MSARKKLNNPWIFLFFSALLVLLVTCLSIYFIHERIPTRVGVVIVGDPTIVFSYDQIRNSITALSVPSDVYVDVVRGYGSYPISSVWKLDSLDKRRGVVLTETVEEAIGIPIRFFINPVSRGGSTDSIDVQIKNALSFFSCIRVLFQKNQTNISPGMFFELSRAVRGMGPTDMTFIDLSNQAVFWDSALADGTSVKKIDSGKLALILGTHAEDPQIRKENLRIAVFNSTKSSGLAQTISRIMEGVGFHVSSIANIDNMEPSACIIRGKKEIFKTNTVQTLQWLYGCTFQEDAQDSQSDVTLIIGTDFEKRFFPF